MRFETTRTFPCNTFSACADIANGGSGNGGNSGGTNNPNCSDPDYRATHPECGDDPRCSDPAFAAANPTLCLNSTRLIVKPSAAVVEVLQGVQYVAFLVTGGVETELTEGVVWSIDDISIALIGAGSGNVTGVAVGITSVYATYGALTAAAQLEVIADGACADRENHFLLLCDVSKSSGGAFASAFSTRLAFAKEVMENFVVTGNLTRDHVALMKFDTSGTEVEAFTQDEQPIVDAITSLSTTQEQTSLSQALMDAQNYFEAQGVPPSGAVIVLLTDGENNTGTDPLPIAQEIRDSGVILIVVGLRAKFTPFRMLERMASGGFFVNALKDNYGDVPAWVSGMRQYLCSGNCVPIGNVTLGVGQLDFTDFTEWNVTAGHVDLIGKVDEGVPFYDLVPGNGLYVDDHGSSSVYPGRIETKDSFALVVGHQYRLSVSIAGHNRPDSVSARSTLIEFGRYIGGDFATYVEEIIAEQYTDGFTTETFEFTATAVDACLIRISGQVTLGEDAFGNLIRDVLLEDITADEEIFSANFNEENLTYVPPSCGEGENGEVATYGYDCYNTCLDGVIPEQIPDTSPLPNLEGEANPTIYTSTKAATYCCPDDLTNCAQRVATAESDISQADAEQKAYAAALALATAAVDCS